MPSAVLMIQGNQEGTTMTIEIDTEQVINELTEDREFGSWIDERIDERIPSGGGIDTDELRQALNQGTFRIVEGTFYGPGMTEHAIDGSAMAEQMRAQLESMPADYDNRCPLGRAFTEAVRRVLVDILRGDTEETSIDREWASALQRLLPGAITAPPTPEPLFPVGTQVTCGTEGAGTPHAYIPGECIDPVPVDGDPGASDSYTAPTTATLVDEDGDEVDRAAFTREVLCVPMSGNREFTGSVIVTTNETTDLFHVEHVGRNEFVFSTAAEAMSKALALTAWNLVVVEPTDPDEAPAIDPVRATIGEPIPAGSVGSVRAGGTRYHVTIGINSYGTPDEMRTYTEGVLRQLPQTVFTESYNQPRVESVVPMGPAIFDA